MKMLKKRTANFTLTTDILISVQETALIIKYIQDEVYEFILLLNA